MMIDYGLSACLPVRLHLDAKPIDCVNVNLCCTVQYSTVLTAFHLFLSIICTISLNVVIGPNGTGKSTILCAICLGLGGQPDLLGRAGDARDFIMHEKEIAMIEIELAPFPNSPTHVLKRTIDRNKGSTGKKSRGIAASTYEINGTVVKLEQVKKLVSETYRIAIDNLCTFLPQDRVGSFSGFDSKQLLKETELSVSASGHLWETHQKLMQLEEEMQNSHFDLETARAELNRLEQEVNRLEREKALMEEREECVQKLQLYEKKMLWVCFEEKRLAALDMKEQRKQVKDRLKVAQQGMAPLMGEISRLEHEYDRGKHQRVALQKDTDQYRRIYYECLSKAEKHQDALDGISNELSAVDSMKRNAENAVKAREGKVQEILSILSNYPSEEEIGEKVKAVQDELRALKHEMNMAKREVINQQK
jgi:chromosome segregation ATPase